MDRNWIILKSKWGAEPHLFLRLNNYPISFQSPGEFFIYVFAIEITDTVNPIAASFGKSSGVSHTNSITPYTTFLFC